MSIDHSREVPRTLAVTLALWAGAVAAAEGAGVFPRLPAEVLAALSAFAVSYAAAVVRLDRRVGAWLAPRRAKSAAVAAAGMLALAMAGAGLSAGGGAGQATAPGAWLLLFVLPLTGAAALAAFPLPRRASGRAAGGRVRSPAWRGPAPPPAAP